MSTSITQFNHLRIPLDEIQKATNYFSEENIIGEGGFGNIYKGRLLRTGEDIDVYRQSDLGPKEFGTEVSVLSDLNHPNIVSLIGFCDEKKEKIIITRHEAKGSLSKCLSDPALTCIQRLKICRGVANAISYLHYKKGRDYSIVHGNINSSTILLDDDFEAKLSGFEYSIKDPVDRMERYIPFVVNPNPDYKAPEILKSEDVTQFSDIYSFGVVLSKIMCGGNPFLPTNNKLIAAWLKMYLHMNALESILIPDMWNQMEPESCKRFVELTLSCLEKDPVNRLNIDHIRCLIEGYWQIQSHKITPVTSTIQGVQISRTQEKIDENSKSKIAKLVKVNKLEHLKIELIDIQSATNYFSKESELWSEDHYGQLYKGDLQLFDKKYVSSLEGKNKGELPKRRYNVRILRIDNATAVDLFCKEIEILTTCKHDNIDSLLGFCDGEDSHMTLVYEGSTYNHLSVLLNNDVLTWEMRLKICLDVAHGLNYLHNEMENQKMVIHRQLSSFCIMLDDNWQATKITGFGLSTFHENQDEVPYVDYALKGLVNGAGLRSMAPEISKRNDEGMVFYMAKATKESDIYSFGVVMFEILCGASCTILRDNDGEFRPVHWFKDRKIKQKVAPVLKEENHGNKLFFKKGPNEGSLDMVIKIIKQCLVVNPKQRPTLQAIVKQLDKALTLQKNHKDHLRMSYKDLEAATNCFNSENKIGEGYYGDVYKGVLASEHKSSTIVAKRLRTFSSQGDRQFKNELHILSVYKNDNVISLGGYNNDGQERIVVYNEYASNGSLANHLNNASLTWINRLNICIDVATGLAFLHAGVPEQAVIHRDIKPANILLFDGWKAKLADFGRSLICTINDKTNYVIDHAEGTPRYLDPQYEKSRILTKECDIYSLGVVLLEILCGKPTAQIKKLEKNQSLCSFVEQCIKEDRSKEIVFAIKDKIGPEALDTFLAIAYKCLLDDREKRPTAQDVLVQLQKAWELQVMYLFPRNPRDGKKSRTCVKRA